MGNNDFSDAFKTLEKTSATMLDGKMSIDMIRQFWPQYVLITLVAMTILGSLVHSLRNLIKIFISHDRRPFEPCIKTFFGKKPTTNNLARNHSYEWEIVPIRGIHNNFENHVSHA